MQEFFLKVPLLKKILEFQNQKKAMKFVQKKKIQTKNETNDRNLTK